MIDNRENNRWTVYIHIVPKAITKYDYDKYYVGITGQSVERRWRNNGSGYKNCLFERAINKYGWDNIEHYIIAGNLTKDEACSFEMKLIKELDCHAAKGRHGYNETDGGEGQTGYRHSQETKEKISKANMGRSYTDPWNKISKERKQEIRELMSKRFSGEGNPRYGTHCTQETKDKISEANKGQERPNAPQCVKVYRFNLNFEYIDNFYSIKKAEKDLNLNSGNISRCVNNLQYSYENYIWRSDKDIYIDSDGIIHPINLIKSSIINRKIYQFTSDSHKFVNKYDKLKFAVNSNEKFKQSTIINCLSHINKTAYGYIWRYEEDIGFIENGEPYFIA